MIQTAVSFREMSLRHSGIQMEEEQEEELPYDDPGQQANMGHYLLAAESKTLRLRVKLAFDWLVADCLALRLRAL